MVKNSTSINGFKNKYDKWRNTQPLIENDDSASGEKNEAEND